MIIDKENLFSENQAITGSAVSTNLVDLGPGDKGPGEELNLFVQVTEAFNNLTDLTVEVQTDDDAAFPAPVVVARSPAVAAAALTAGAEITGIRALPQGLKRYLRLNYVVTGTNPTTGKVTAGLTLGRQTNA